MDHRYVGLQRPPTHRAEHSLTVRPYKRARWASLKRPLEDRVGPEPLNKIMKSTLVARSRKRRRPRRRYSRKRRMIPRALTPRSILRRIRSVTYISQGTHTNGALQMLPVQLNSFDDPFTTGSTEQPLGFDQYRALFREAFVVGSSVKLEIVNNDATQAMVVGLTPMPQSQGTTGLTDYEHYLEYPGTKHVLVTPDMDKQFVFSKISTRRHLHLNKLRDNDQVRLNLVTETPPTLIAYWHVWSQPMAKTSDPTNDVAIVIVAEYLVVFVNPVVPDRSYET